MWRSIGGSIDVVMYRSIYLVNYRLIS